METTLTRVPTNYHPTPSILRVGSRLERGEKWCPKCRMSKAMSLFLSKTGKKYGYCHACRNARERERYNATEKRDKQIEEMNIAREAYDGLLIAQLGKCAICNERAHEGQVLQVDRNVSTGAVRDLLCVACHNLLEDARENPDVLLRAVTYLAKHSPQAIEEKEYDYRNGI